MRSSVLFLLAIAAVAGLSATGTHVAAQGRKSIEERPFGGPPPPISRSVKKNSKKCKTATSTCELEKAQLIGSDCKCAEGSTVLEGKVVE